MATLLTKKSDTASSVPLAADLTNAAGGAELAVNTADKRLYSKTSGGAIVELGTNPSSMTLPNGAANGIPYLNGSKVLTSGSALTFDGTNLGVGLTPFSFGSYAGISVGGAAGGALSFGTGGAEAGRITGQSGYLNFYGGTVGSVSELMRLTSTGLGIGTSSPSARLTIQESAASPTALNMLNRNGTQRWALAVDAAAVDDKILAFIDQTNSAVRMALDTSGNLGLGVTPSAWGSGGKLEMGAGQIISMQGAANLASNAYYNAGWKYTTSTFASYYSQSSGQHQWYTAPSGTAGNAISFTQAMTLDASGRLLLNRTSGAGRFNIAQTSTEDLIIANIGTSGAVVSIGGSGTTMTSMYMVTSSGLAGQITNSGTTTIYSVTSDHRLKNVIGSIIDAGSRIDALEPIEYEWKTDGKRTRGFLAHKFQEIYPHSVHGEKDAVDTEGNPAYQTMQAGSAEVIADLVAEIQSLRARVAQLEGK